jgi:hypothetical protein
MSMSMRGAVSVRVSVAVAAVLVRMSMLVVVFVDLVLVVCSDFVFVISTHFVPPLRLTFLISGVSRGYVKSEPAKRHCKRHLAIRGDICRHQTRHILRSHAFQTVIRRLNLIAGTPCSYLLFYHLLQAETAGSYTSILIKYMVFLKALEPHMGDKISHEILV